MQPPTHSYPLCHCPDSLFLTTLIPPEEAAIEMAKLTEKDVELLAHGLAEK
jgi:hypothetical protein